MRTRVPVTGTRARCHQARSRDQRLVSRALNQHFNSNCHLSKSVNYLAIVVCSRGKDKRYKSFWLHIKPVFLDPRYYNLSWSDWMTGGHCSDCWYWNIFVRLLRQAGVTWQSSPRVSPLAPEYGTSPRWSCPGPRLLLGRAWRPGQLHHGQGAGSSQLSRPRLSCVYVFTAKSWWEIGKNYRL